MESFREISRLCPVNFNRSSSFRLLFTFPFILSLSVGKKERERHTEEKKREVPSPFPLPPPNSHLLFRLSRKPFFQMFLSFELKTFRFYISCLAIFVEYLWPFINIASFLFSLSYYHILLTQKVRIPWSELEW